jgi:hypothetical protein
VAATPVTRDQVWQRTHPLPAGWRPVTRRVGFQTFERWQYTVAVDGDRGPGRGHVIDSGHRWLPQGLTPAQAAWEMFTDWRDDHAITAPAILAGEIDRLVCAVRRHPGGEVGMVFGADF